ncbi:MAG: helix-turn-helix domain-containing protein [Rhodoferax sp.]|nr:helix-turn-helix domain-containing protein [Rhodoferax sp.]
MHKDPEMEAFKADLLEAVRDMKAGRAARETRVTLSAVAEARLRTALSQAQFAQLLGVSVRTLQEWEQGRRQPSGAAQSLLRVAQSHPEVLRELVAT